MEMGGRGKPCRLRQSSVGCVAALAQLSRGPRLGCWPQQGQVKTLQRDFARECLGGDGGCPRLSCSASPVLSPHLFPIGAVSHQDSPPLRLEDGDSH